MAGKKKKQNIAAQVRSVTENTIIDMGFILWDVNFYKEGAESILEISVDKKGGVSIDDCSKITKAIAPLIDELDPIYHSYSLVVSSAGYDRELRLPSHIHYAIENSLPVKFKLYAALEGKKEYCGIIKDYNNDNISLIIENESIIIVPKKQVSKITATACE